MAVDKSGEVRAGTIRQSGARKGIGQALVPAFLLAGTTLGYLVFGTNAHMHFLFFLPVAFAGAGLGARAGLLSSVAAIAIVGLIDVLGERGYLTDQLRVLAIDDGSFLIWAAFLALTGYIVGLLSQRGGSRGVGRDLNAEIMSAVEREHARIGYDLHDTVAQTATAALLEAEILSSVLQDASPDVRRQSDRLVGVLGAVADQIRSLIVDLRPPALDSEEFIDSLHGLVEDFSDRTGVKMEFSVEGGPQHHADPTRIAVYRVIQEALTNVEHHANASRAFVSVRATKKTVYLLIADDGVGFDPASVNGNGKPHLGLQGMKERVALLNGELDIETAPNRGTDIRVRIPAQ